MITDWIFTVTPLRVVPKWQWQMPLSLHIISSNNAGSGATLTDWHHHYLYFQGIFPTLNTTGTKLPQMVTPMSARSYSESTDQEMDIWLKLTLSPSSSVIKTLSFTVTPFLISCGGKHLGYRKCGKAGHCIREQFFCDGTVNCGVKNSVWPSGTSGHHWTGEVVWCGVV